MNSAKKVVKGKLTAEKQSRKKESSNGRKRKWGAVLLAVALGLTIGAIVQENLLPKLILTVNGEKIYLEDMTYQIMLAEQSHNSIASLYQQMGYTQDYWDMEQDGVTNQESAKQQVIEAEIQQQILYAEAIKNGYEATEEEKEAAADSAKEMLESMTEEQKKKTGFTEEELTQILTSSGLVERYKQDLIDSFDIDDEELRAGVDQEQYRQYETQCLFVSTEGEEDAELTEAEKEERKEALLKEAEAIRDVEDWSTALDSDEKQVVSYRAIRFIKEDTSYDAKVMETAITMENGEISDVVEGEDGYYIIKMVNNNSQERYEEEVENAIEEVENQRFDEKYLSIYEGYEVSINDKEWNKVELGSLTM